MSRAYDEVKATLEREPRTWLVTGAAGFIGSHLVAELLRLGQKVRGLDNFVTGHEHNLTDLKREVGTEAAERFEFLKGDITKATDCRKATGGIDYVLHEAALGSVPRSIEGPVASHRANVDGFLQILLAARENGVKRFVYASSSSVYGDSEELPKREDRIGNPLSPYAATKRIDEIYAATIAQVYQLSTAGLRYFNVFGPRQDPNGPYAAVIPRWIESLLKGQPCIIYGDGLTSRDFCYVDNVVQANILSAVEEHGELSPVYNIALGQTTSLKQLYQSLRKYVCESINDDRPTEPTFEPFRTGDIRHSLAEVSKVRMALGYEPSVTVDEGLKRTVAWYVRNSAC